jgi:hypothetical protein
MTDRRKDPGKWERATEEWERQLLRGPGMLGSPQ